jgi:hypothetical protein
MVRPEALDRCPWLCSAPDGPNTAFDWPIFFVIDTLRILMTVGAFALIGVSTWAISRSRVNGQKCRFAAFAAACIYMFGTELSHLGDTPHWRFLVGLACTALALWGYYQHLFRELPARAKPDPEDRSL